jgi:hypothetical protein
MALGDWLQKFIKIYFKNAGKPIANSKKLMATLPVTFSIQTLLPSKVKLIAEKRKVN